MSKSKYVGSFLFIFLLGLSVGFLLLTYLRGDKFEDKQTTLSDIFGTMADQNLPVVEEVVLNQNEFSGKVITKKDNRIFFINVDIKSKESLSLVFEYENQFYSLLGIKYSDDNSGLTIKNEKNILSIRDLDTSNFQIIFKQEIKESEKISFHFFKDNSKLFSYDLNSKKE